MLINLANFLANYFFTVQFYSFVDIKITYNWVAKRSSVMMWPQLFSSKVPCKNFFNIKKIIALLPSISLSLFL